MHRFSLLAALRGVSRLDRRRVHRRGGAWIHTLAAERYQPLLRPGSHLFRTVTDDSHTSLRIITKPRETFFTYRTKLTGTATLIDVALVVAGL